MFAWQDIECRVQDRADKTREIALLNGISGAAQTSDLVAIIGGWVGHVVRIVCWVGGFWARNWRLMINVHVCKNWYSPMHASHVKNRPQRRGQVDAA